eukprot:1525905-Alexandrium_andersonii.AAC.1
MKLYRDRLPSAYLVADGLLQADLILGQMLYRQPDGKRASDTEKKTLALADAASIKKLCSYVRYLARAHPGSYEPTVASLKSLVQRKGSKRRKAEAEVQISSDED